MNKKLFVIAMMSLSVMACEKQSDLKFSEIITESDVKQSVLSEMADAITNSGTSTAFCLASLIQDSGDEYETVYPETIASERTTKSLFSLNDVLLNEINSNVGNYPHLTVLMGGATKSSAETSLTSIPVEFYFPNSEKFNVNEEMYVTLGYPSFDNEDWTDGYRYSKDGSKEYVSRIDESYLENNMTILLLPLDTTEYTKPMSDEELELYMNERISPTKSSTISNGLLKTNVYDSNLIREQDVLYTNVAAIRVDGTNWCGAISNKLKLAIYRASGDVEFGIDGSIKASGSSHKPILIPISKKDLKSKVWQQGNYLFDDDWDLHEYDQKIYFVSEHNTGSGSADMDASVGIGFKDGKFSADFGFNVSAKVTFEKHSILRVHNQLVRKSMLAGNINDMGNGLYNGFAIHRYSIVDLVFNFYYTKID